MYFYGNNITEVKRTVNWRIRYSLLATLGHKHKKSITWAIQTDGKSPRVLILIHKNRATLMNQENATNSRKAALGHPCRRPKPQRA